MGKLAIAALAGAGVSACALVLDRTSAAWISAVALTVVPTFAGIQALRAANQRVGRTRTAWAMLGVAAFVWAAGSAAWGAITLADGDPNGSAASLLYVLSYPIAVAAMISFAPGDGRRSMLVRLFDALLIATSVLAVSWTLVLQNVWHSDTSSVAERVFGVSYALGDAVLVALVIFVVMRQGVPDRSPLIKLGAGLAVLALTDGLYLYSALTTGYSTGHPVDGGYVAGFALSALGAMQARATAYDVPHAPHEGALRLHLPYVAAASALVIALSAQIVRRDLDLFLLVLLLAVFGLVIIRQFLVMMDHQAQTISQLRSVDEMKNGILRAVSHELRTPLTFIKGSATFLQEDDETIDPALRRDLYTRLVRNSDRLESLVVGLLDLERLTRGVIEPDRRRIDVTRLMLNVADNLHTPAHQIRVVGRSVDAFVDPGLVERIVENLMVNATRHTPTGTTATARAERTPDGLLIRVDDQGVGVPPDQRERIFHPFVQMADALEAGRGTGIGLSLVAKFAEVHGGRAWVEDAPTGGASFNVLLPDGLAEDVSPPAPTAPLATVQEAGTPDLEAVRTPQPSA